MRRGGRTLLAGALRRALAVAVLVTAGLLAAAPARAAEFGMSDGRAGLFDSPDLALINFKHVRLVLPWNAAYSDGPWRAWLDRATGYGLPVLVAPSIDDAHSCTGGSCSGPTPAQYADALGKLLAQYPVISAVEAWNEPNHSMQPTSRSAALAAHYFDVAFDACAGGRCIAVAGNMLDAQSMGGYLAQYKAALTRTPAVWGIHNYYDATYFGRSGLDQMLATTTGPIWLTETGGLVTFKAGSGGALPYDEHRAADSLRWLFTLALKEPRIQRMYLYGMWQQSWNPFDSALIRQDNTEREGLAVARAYIGKRKTPLAGPAAPVVPATVADAPAWVDPVTGVSADAGIFTPTKGPGVTAAGQSGAAKTTGATAAATATGGLRVSGKRLKVDDDREVTVSVRCVGPAKCAGKLVVAAGSWRFRHGVKLRPAAEKSFTVRLTPRAARQVSATPRPTAWAAACTATCGSQGRIPLVRR